MHDITEIIRFIACRKCAVLSGPTKRWGYCSICNIPLMSEQHASEHVLDIQHQSNEAALDELEARSNMAPPPQLTGPIDIQEAVYGTTSLFEILYIYFQSYIVIFLRYPCPPYVHKSRIYYFVQMMSLELKISILCN